MSEATNTPTLPTSVFIIHVWDPKGDEYNPGGREYYADLKGVFLTRELAESIVNGMRMFQEIGDESTYSVREIKLNPETSFSEYLDNNLPGRKAG
jgi:hypothetical protein